MFIDDFVFLTRLALLVFSRISKSARKVKSNYFLQNYNYKIQNYIIYGDKKKYQDHNL